MDSTFEGNSADTGGGLYYDAYASSPAVTNCIIWGNSAAAGSGIYHTSYPPTVTYSDVEGGCTVDAGCTADETGNIDADPMFMNDDADAGPIDLRLQTASPCIDTGSNDAVPTDVTTDLDGNPRIVDGDGDSTATVDMGAYEYQP